MLKVNKIYCGDCIKWMKKIDEDSIDLAITSPPYYLNKEYEKTITYKDYKKMMKNVFEETNRILKPGGYFVINFGDYFNSGNRFYTADVPACYPASMNFFRWGVKITQMDLQATRIWRKQFAKMGIPFVCNTHPRNIFDYEHIWTFRKRSGSKEEFVNDRKLSQRGVIGENWTSVAGIEKHCAAFPIELPEWALRVYSKNEDDVVLDMFGGSGTTGLAAKNLNRNFILIEKEYEYCKIAKERTGAKIVRFKNNK